jgi:hypothetical protein
MNNSSFNHSNKERRLIHFADEALSGGAEAPETPESQLKALRNQVSASARAHFDKLAKDWNVPEVSKEDRMRALTALSQLSDTEESELLVQGADLAEKLGPDGIVKIGELYVALRAGKQDEVNRIFESMSPEDRAAIIKSNAGVMKKFGQLIEGQSKVDQFGNKVENFLERNEDQITRFIALIANIMQQFQALMDQWEDAIEYNPRVIATKDKFIDKQIKDTKVSPEIITQHKNNTIDEINGIDKGGNPTAIKAKKTEVADLKKEKKDKLADAKPGSETIKVTKEFDGYVADAEKQLNEMESKLRTGKARRPILMARLKRINSRFGLSAEDGLNSSSSDRVAETEPAAPTKTPEEIETEAKVAAMKKAKAALSFIDTMLKERKEKDDEVDVKIAELNTALLKMDESEREAFVTSEKIQPTTLASGDSDHRMIETVEGTVYEVKYKDDFALDFVKYEAGAEV